MLSLKQIRVGADLTIEDACKLCKCSAPTFAKWEKEPGKMGIKAFFRLIKYYNSKNPEKQISYKDVEL